MTGKLFVPLIIIIFLTWGIIKGVKVYEVFAEGALDGIKTVFRITPYLITMLFAIDLFRNSGALDSVVKAIAPAAGAVGMPTGVLPMFFIKPLSGNGALGILTDTIRTYGADSREGRIAAVMMGSTETIFYTLAVYLGAAKIKDARESLPAALIAHVFGTAAAIIICSFYF